MPGYGTTDELVEYREENAQLSRMLYELCRIVNHKGFIRELKNVAGLEPWWNLAKLPEEQRKLVASAKAKLTPEEIQALGLFQS